MPNPTPDPTCRACGETIDLTSHLIGSFHRACLERLLAARQATQPQQTEGSSMHTISPPAYPYPAIQRHTNGLAVASLVLGIVWLWWLGSLLAIIFGVTALHQIERSGGILEGRGLAIAGCVLGWAGFVGGVALFGFAALFAVLSATPV